MKVAIYARYSSENQSEKSIDDQIRVCKNYAQDNSMVVEDKYIYIDEEFSGGWNLSSISRILKSEKYMGLWIWKKHKNVKDPMTGRIKRILCPENEWLSKVEKLVASGMNEVPELIKKKRAQYDKSSLEMRNYLNYIKMGNFSKAVSGALKEVEAKTENLELEIKSLEFQKQNNFKSPPKEWIKHRLENLHETLDKNISSSDMTLKEILGTIQLEPVSDKNEDIDCIINNEKEFKPYYVAHTKIQTLALLDDKDKGSNWSQWWRRGESNPGPYTDK